MTSGVKLPFHPIPSICECTNINCNEITWNGRKYLSGHNNRGKKSPRTEEHTKNQSLSNTKIFLLKSDGSKEIYPKIPVICNCSNLNCNEICWNGNYKKGHNKENKYHPSYGMLGKTHTKLNKEKSSKRMKGNSYRKGYKPTLGFKKGHKIHLGRKASIEARKNMSDAQKEYIINNPEVLKRMLRFNSPNKSELKLLDILNDTYPNEWKFVGDGSFIIDGKCPDYINCNNKKLIIELFGERWHEKSEEEQRKEIFKKFGYNTLIIWFKELKNIEKLKEKLKLFNNLK